MGTETTTQLTETVGGTGIVDPVITLTADMALGSVTIIVANATTGDTIQWTGSIDDEDVLVFDSEKWLVTLNGTASMSTVTREFITLQPGANVITVTGFSGEVEITHRSRYL